MSRASTKEATSPEALRHDRHDDAWIARVAERAAACDRSQWESGDIQVIQGREQLLAARGRIREHTDSDFPAWSYLLILEAPASSVLHVRGYEPLKLEPGMLVEFRSHVRHRLVQKHGHDTAWCPLDSDTQLDLDTAFGDLERMYAR